MKWVMLKEEEDIDKQIAELEDDVPEATVDKKEEDKGEKDTGDYWD